MKKLIQKCSNKVINIGDYIYWNPYDKWIFCGISGNYILVKKYKLDLNTTFHPERFDCELIEIREDEVTFNNE